MIRLWTSANAKLCARLREVVDPLGGEAEELQGEVRMRGETRAEARPRHHNEGGLCQRHGGPHVWGFFDQPQIAKQAPRGRAGSA